LVIQRQIGDRYHISNCLNNLGGAVCALGEYERAGSCFYEALQLAAEIGADPLALEILTGVASLAAKDQRQDATRAARLFAFVHHHPASDGPTKGRAERGLTEVASHLPPESLTEAREWAADQKLATVLAEVLGQETMDQG
jgi:hypothetical protein